MFVDELRLRVEHYFKIVVYTVRVTYLHNLGHHSQKHRLLPCEAIPRQHPIHPLQ